MWNLLTITQNRSSPVPWIDCTTSRLLYAHPSDLLDLQTKLRAISGVLEVGIHGMTVRLRIDAQYGCHSTLGKLQSEVADTFLAFNIQPRGFEGMTIVVISLQEDGNVQTDLKYRD